MKVKIKVVIIFSQYKENQDKTLQKSFVIETKFFS